MLIRNIKLAIALAGLVGASHSYAGTSVQQTADGVGNTGQCAETFPLSTKGRYIVDSCGDRFRLKSVNWYGASDSGYIPGGLDKQHRDTIALLLKEKGFNSVRLPFSNQMLHIGDAVEPSRVSANPDLVGKTPLQVYDAVVKALTDAGIAVILNNHTSTSEWCCGYDYNGLWYHTDDGNTYAQSEAQWLADWTMLADRYKSNKAVVGADLRNEVRTMRWRSSHPPVHPNWGRGDSNDWRAVSERAGNAVLDTNPDLLVIVEGISWTGDLPSMGGYRPQLEAAKANPVNLKAINKLVYSAHHYGFTGPQHNGSDDYSSGYEKYSDMTKEELRTAVEKEWAYITELEKIYSAPIWVSEYGAPYGEPEDSIQRAWLKNITDIMIEKDLSFAWWPLNANRVAGEKQIDGYGLLSPDWSRFRNDWRFEHIDRLLTAKGKTGPVADTANYRLMNFEGHDDNQSSMTKNWDHDGSKGTCPDGLRLVGLAQWDRALCSDSHYGDLWADDQATSTVLGAEGPWHRGFDWAPGLTKYECPQGQYVAGVSSRTIGDSSRRKGTNGVLCAKANKSLGNNCQTLWFNTDDNRLSNKADDWVSGVYKAQAADDQYIAGVAHKNGRARAVLACR